MSSTTEELLQEYDTWKTTRAFAGPKNSPTDFIQEKRIERVLDCVGELIKTIVADDSDEWILRYFTEEDIEWIKTRRDVALPVDRAE